MDEYRIRRILELEAELARVRAELEATQAMLSESRKLAEGARRCWETEQKETNALREGMQKYADRDNWERVSTGLGDADSWFCDEGPHRGWEVAEALLNPKEPA